MVSYILSYMLGFLLIFGGNQNHTDLLDTLSTDIYWQIKNVTPSLAQLQRDAGPDAPVQNIDKLLKDLTSDDFQTRDKAKRELESMGPGIAAQLKPAAGSKDPEVAAVASALLKNFEDHAKDRNIRRLMAIRTLGERREKDALPLLNSLKDSRELFVADYAQRALARIEGRPWKPADQSALLQKDLGLLPSESAIVAQSAGLSPQTISLAQLVSVAVDSANAGNPMMGGMGPPEKKLDKKQILLDTSRQLIGLIDHVGNVRLDAVTFAYGCKKEDANWAVIIIRGKYDSAAMYNVVKPLVALERAPDDVTGVLSSIAESFIQNTGGLPMVTMGDEMCLLFPNDDQLIAIATEKSSLYIRNTVCAAVKNGKVAGDPVTAGKDLAGLFKQIDTHAPAWAVGKLTDEMKKDDMLGAFSAFTADSKPAREGVAFTIKGQGTDPEKVKAAVDKLNDGLKMAQASIQQEILQMPALRPIAEFMASLKIATDSKPGESAASATMTGELKAGIMDAIVGEMGPMVLEELQPHEAAPIPAAALEGPPPVANPPAQPAEALPQPMATQPK